MRYLIVLILFVTSCSVTGQDTIPVFSKNSKIKTVYHSPFQIYVNIYKEDITSKDSVNPLEFQGYVNDILAMPTDSIQKLDSLTKYSAKYLSECPFILDKGFNHRICNQNISKLSDTMRLTFIDLRSEGKLYNSNLDTSEPMFFYYPTKDKSYEPFRPEIFNILSFKKGKYLIVHTRITVPDTRGSLPPGVDLTLFLEKIE